MNKNDFMVMEQLASLRRDNEILTKKQLEHDLKAKKKAAAIGSGDKGVDDHDLPAVSTKTEKRGTLQRPGSRGNPLAPINPRNLAPQVAE